MTALPLVCKGLLLGWAVAWPPGPVNAEMIRRGLTRGFFAAWAVGLGACSGDFLWALSVALGAGSVIGLPGVRHVLGIVSIALLLMLAWLFGRGAWRDWRARKEPPAPTPRAAGSARNAWLLGLTMALTSPWNIAFWLAVIGSQATNGPMNLASSLIIAASVVAGAASCGLILCAAVRLGAGFATPAWHIATQAATATLMLFFALRSAWRLTGAGF